MSELNLQALAERGNDKTKAPTAMQEVNLALKACGFGLFHIQLLFTSFIGFVAGIMVTNSTPYILPIAECDLNMNLLQKGVLNATPFIGMVSISVVAGFLTDTFGRKIFLVGGYGGLFIFTFIGGTSQTYIVLVIAKLFEGMLFSASFNPVVTLTSEFCHNGIRDRIMLLQSSFAAIGQTIGALFSWVILTQQWQASYFNGFIVLNTWNFYLIIMSLWSLLASVLYMLLPESPKYFITQNRYDEAKKILINVYTRNTGKPPDTFPALAERGNDKTKAPTAMQEVNLALKACGFGLFHIQLLFTSFIGFVAGIMVTNSTPYILPIAECDLNMNLLQKGVLNATPFIGMVSISVVAGFLTDTFGRKIFLVGGYGGLFIFTFIGGTSQTYIVLVIAKLFEGMLFSASFNPVVTLTSEFCHNGIRDRIMLLQSSFAAIGQTIGALFSWVILTQQWQASYFNGFIVLNTWNFYLIIMSLWSLLASVLYMLLPESPKYFITQNRYDEAKKILINVYTRNTGKPPDTFPYPDLWKDKMKQALDERAEKTDHKLSNMLTVGLHNAKPMFQKPLGLYLLLFCVMMFFTMILYNVIRLWFPQLSTIVEYYSSPQNQDLCVMLDAYTSDLRLRSLNTSIEDVCVPAVSGGETYLNSVILGSICVIPFIISGVLVGRVSKKNLYIVCGLIAVGVTLGLRWASSKTAMVALFSSDVSVAHLMNSLNQALVIEHFPTTTRSLAIAVLMTSGRVGSLVGNVLFPILLDMGCVVPFYTLAGTMILVIMLGAVIPEKKK